MLLANTGVPMIAVELPTMIVALVPIILLEAAIYRQAGPMPWRDAWRGSSWANLASTFLGVPAAWFALVIVQMVGDGGSAWGLKTPLDRLAAVTLQSAWLIPYEDELHWMIPAAACVLLIPFFAASVATEAWVLRLYWPEDHRSRLVHRVTFANVASYALLALFWGVQLYWALTNGRES